MQIAFKKMDFFCLKPLFYPQIWPKSWFMSALMVIDRMEREMASPATDSHSGMALDDS